MISRFFLLKKKEEKDERAKTKRESSYDWATPRASVRSKLSTTKFGYAWSGLMSSWYCVQPGQAPRSTIAGSPFLISRSHASDIEGAWSDEAVRMVRPFA
jgi:hypothetical protein